VQNIATMICMGGLATLIKDIVKIAYDTFRNKSSKKITEKIIRQSE